MTDLKSILIKDVERTIDGVIKADDDAHIIQEVDEYVLTREIQKYLDKLITGYNNSVEACKKGSSSPHNGVWISGYFGSGKSHLLKILSYVLENSEAESKKLSEIFIDKISDRILKGDLSNALKTPSKSILFNIDQQADAAHAGDDNAILYIFEKVFNRMLGYFPEDRNIAEFERHLNEEGKYEKFKEDYNNITGNLWTESRSKAFRIGRSKLVKVLSDSDLVSSEEDARALIEQYKQGNSLSVESLAKRVKNYLDSQDDPSFRLNFFIDEVGQFIADKTRLMLNLQTITETMATVCNGRVWIFVTSQEDLKSVVGDPTESQVQDYSKIHARFHYRISLTSKDVQEVIQKRLLDKTEKGFEDLGNLYMKEKETFRTLFRFDQGGKNIQFKDRDQFILSYPFQAYQYNLLQQSLKGLSEHNAFMGRHVSRGERSMLEIFQDVSKELKDKPLYIWATFDMMFKGIRETLNTFILEAVNLAERNLDNPLAVRILKILLLVKYVKDFNSTKEHLKVLLIESLDQDLSALDKEMEAALTLLEHKSYIQRNGNFYEYLTNEEKDIEEEIKQVDVSHDNIRDFLNDNVLTSLLGTSKIRYKDSQEDYSYKKLIDGESRGGRSGNADLAIHFITPFNDNYTVRKTILNQSMAKKEMTVFLNDSSIISRDLRLFLQTDLYCRQNSGHEQNSQARRIINDKQQLNSERKQNLISQIKNIIGESDVYVMDSSLQINIKDPKDRIETAFQTLVRKSYPNLSMLKNHYAEISLKNIFYPNDREALFGNGGTGMDEAETEMFHFIVRRHKANENRSLNSIFEYFSANQYGWYFWAISCVLAKLYMRDAVEIEVSHRLKSKDEVFSLLSGNKGFDTVTVNPAPVINQVQIEELKNLYTELFHSELKGAKARDYAVMFKKTLLEQVNELEMWRKNSSDSLSFIAEIDPVIKRCRAIFEKEYSYILEHVSDYSDSLLNDFINEIDPLKTFMSESGTQSTKWKEIHNWFERNKDNLDELELSEDKLKMNEYLKSVPYKNNILRKTVKLSDELKNQINNALSSRTEDGMKAVEGMIESLSSMEEYNSLEDAEKDSVLMPFDRLIEKIKDNNQLSRISILSGRTAKEVLEKVKKEIHSIVNPEKTVLYASDSEKRISYRKTELVTEDDVRDYVRKLETHYLDLIRDNKRIGL